MRQASAAQMINHRGPEFRDLIARTTERLKQIFQTQHDVLTLTVSGTGGMEAAIVNTLSPGDKVLAVSVGVFGDRFAQIAQAYGAIVIPLRAPNGKAADPDQLRRALKSDPAIKAVLVTHNETSTGVTNDLATLSSIVKKEFGKLLLVDGVSSVGSIPCPMDRWELDVLVSGSQKGWMAAPGLAFVGVGPTAWKAASQAKMPRFYLDFARAKSSLEKGQTPWTPAISVMYGLDMGLKLLLDEGMDNVHARHAELGARTRRGVKALGLELFADEAVASNTVTAVKVPPGLDEAKFRKLLREEYRVVLSGGQGEMQGKIFRIGHLGYVTAAGIDDTLQAMRGALATLGTGVPASKPA